jgi:diazepam-binding inhibitor (GABA receptor modulating acyl-CoA-binding protein)
MMSQTPNFANVTNSTQLLVSPAIREQFLAAAKFVRETSEPPIPLTNQTKLDFYAYYKQADLGNVRGDRPFLFQFEARAKYDAWKTLEDVSTLDAMKTYIVMVHKYMK